jgi:phosphoserine phosphatase
VTDIQLITFSGEDQGGLTAGITAILAGHGVNVLDIGQAVIHATLSMGVLVEIPADCDREALSAALQSYASERSMRVRIAVGRWAGAGALYHYPAGPQDHC